MSHGNVSAEDQRYLVSNKKEVLQILSELAKQKTTLSVAFNHGQESFLTTVIAVDDVKQVAYLDIGRDEAFNQRLLASQDVVVSNNIGIRIHWSCHSLKLATLKDGNAISIGLPTDLVRVQRREYFRHPTPVRPPVLCRIPLASGDGANGEDENILQFSLTDVSVGGIGAIAPDPLHEAISVGAQFDNCKIEFPGVGTTNLTLCVRQVKHIVMKSDTSHHRVGFEFINPSRGNQALIQRYTFILESESLALNSSR